VPFLAHGGAGGLVVELGLVVALVALGVRVWLQSRRLERASASPRPGDEAGVEEDDGEGEREGGLRDAEAEESAPAGRH
jgi:hypothetical protein